MYGCSEQGSSPSPPTPAPAPTTNSAVWTQPSISLNATWEAVPDQRNLPNNPMHSYNSTTGATITDTTFGLNFSFDPAQYSVGNEIIVFRITIQRPDGEPSTISIPKFTKASGDTNDLRLASVGPTLTIPPPTGKSIFFDILSTATTQYGETVGIGFENPDEIGSFEIVVYIQAMGNNGIAGDLEQHTFTPYTPPEYARICGPTTNINALTMRLTSDFMEEVGYPNVYSATFNYPPTVASTAFSPDVPIRWTIPDSGGECATGEDAMYQVSLDFNFGPTIPATMVQPMGSDPNIIRDFTMTINQISGGPNNPIFQPSFEPTPDPTTIFNLENYYGGLEEPFQQGTFPVATTPPMQTINQLIGLDDGLLTFGTMFPSGSVNTSTASITFTGTLLCDAYGKQIELAEMGTPIEIPVSNFVALC